VARIIELFT